MAITVNFYTFSKRHNSTAQPSTAAVSYDCNLKSPCGVVNPTIILNEQQNPSAWNYAYIADFNRYYYVQEWTYNRGLWEAALRCDVLATWKTNIGSSKQYIIRCSSESNGNVMDMYYPTTVPTMATYSFDSLFPANNPGGGAYVVGIINGDPDGIGAVGYYAFTVSQFRSFMVEFLSSLSWANLDLEEAAENSLKTQFNPFQYIVSVNWFPFTIGGRVVTSLKVGWWTLDATCTRLDSFTDVAVLPNSILLNKHPQAARGNYLNLAPFSRYTLYVQPFGVMELDSTLLCNASQLSVKAITDLVTGKSILDIEAILEGSVPITVTRKYGQVGVPIQLAQILRDDLMVYTSAISGAFGLAGSAFSGGAAYAGGKGSTPAQLRAGSSMFGFASNAISFLGDVYKSCMPTMMTSGSNGSFLDYSTYLSNKLVYTFFNVVDEDNANLGRPLCSIRTISTIPGYIMTQGADVQTNGTEGENAEIESYMNGGFFYE